MFALPPPSDSWNSEAIQQMNYALANPAQFTTDKHKRTNNTKQKHDDDN
jgi:hypothetical protein